VLSLKSQGASLQGERADLCRAMAVMQEDVREDFLERMKKQSNNERTIKHSVARAVG
jgi:hypothetical protein